MANIQKDQAELAKNARGKIKEVLNAKQKTRLAELEFQYNLQRGNAIAALAAADVELDEDEEKDLQDAMEEMREELRAEIAALTRKMQIKALATILSESKIERLMGDVFEFESGGAGGRTFGGQGRGGPGRTGGPGRRGGDDGGENARRSRRPSSEDDSGGNRRRDR